MTGLNLDPDGLHRVAEAFRCTAALLNADLGPDAAACGDDAVSKAMVGNLNARKGWLAEHLKAGSGQALSAADTVSGNAQAYRATDTQNAAAYGAPVSAAPAGPVAGTSGAAPPPPAAPPALNDIPDISGHEGEQLARLLESGAGVGPVTSAASRAEAVATQANAATENLLLAQTHLIASGQSALHPPLMARISNAMAWTQGVATHAAALSAGFTAAGISHQMVSQGVGPSVEWTVLKQGYSDAVAENAATGGMAQGLVDAFDTALTTKQQQASASATGYQGTGQLVSTPPGALTDPALNPNGPGQPQPDDPTKNKKKHSADDVNSKSQDMLKPLMGALGPMMQSLGKANPLSSVGQLGQALSQGLGQFGKGGPGQHHLPTSPIKPAALNSPHLGAGKGAGGGGIKGGGIGAGTRPAAASASPPTTPASAKPAATTGAAAGARSGAGGASMGGGMMPMGRKMDNGKAKTIKSPYPEDSRTEVEDIGTPGVVGDTTARPAPVVDSASKNAVMNRMAKRQTPAASSDGA